MNRAATGLAGIGRRIDTGPWKMASKAARQEMDVVLVAVARLSHEIGRKGEFELQCWTGCGQDEACHGRRDGRRRARRQE
ncbi:hypothetical protein PR202_ga17980 [Eleusine coracana subsp. coracana]|uniref:Uncharacterized protein n=1 Tax=Eleusine coracana subsp. coracana TaxID=191504 RepID=A0AAV5CRV6_ELECO|nr:hypothetical protein PR202_ga17980 [Eleusine coracana subsp. coracana]